MLGHFLLSSLTTNLNLCLKNVVWPEKTQGLVLIILIIGCTGIQVLFVPFYYDLIAVFL